jgi:hypothetical protein
MTGQGGKISAMAQGWYSDKEGEGDGPRGVRQGNKVRQKSGNNVVVESFDKDIIKFGHMEELCVRKRVTATRGKRFTLTRFTRWL